MKLAELRHYARQRRESSRQDARGDTISLPSMSQHGEKPLPCFLTRESWRDNDKSQATAAVEDVISFSKKWQAANALPNFKQHARACLPSVFGLTARPRQTNAAIDDV